MPPLHRLFFAVRPPDAARPYFIEEQRRFGPGHIIRDEHLHLTTAISNDYRVYSLAVEERMIAIGNAIVADQFPIVLDQVAASRRSVAMCASEPLRSFDTLHRKLARGMRWSGVPIRSGWRFSPHATLLYRHGDPLREWIDPLSWTVTEFVLIHSFVGLTRHEVVGRWPLRVPGSMTLH
jgi:2'-5' RNA ligase